MQLRLWIAGAAAVAVTLGLLAAPTTRAQAPQPAAVFTADGKLEFPKDYRTWVYLSSGLDMTYGPNQPMAGHHMFDNVFVDRAAHAAFLKSGRWPEGAVFVLEIRGGQGEGSINKGGFFQTSLMGVEVHVKDKRFPSGWAFFRPNAQTGAPSAALPQTAACNQCHEKSAAVDTTFVQFYPTLLPIAQEKKTLSEAYLAAEKGAVK